MKRSASVLWAVSLALVLVAVGMPERAEAGEKVLFVSDRDQPGNWDIYEMDVDTRVVRRLTNNLAIDNHPDRAGTKVVWSSTRKIGPPGSIVNNPEGDFELFIAEDQPSSGLENSTQLELTDNTHPDRHPHFKHDGTSIVYSSKYVPVVSTGIKSQCSIPVPTPTECEGLRVITPSGGTPTDIDHDKLWLANPVIWPKRDPGDARWVGHPSFSHDGTQILFSGAVDGEGRNWEVYVAGWNGTTVTSLRQVTKGSTYPDNPNPIKMSAGAHFTMGGTIIFSSTRTPLGNSQLFELPASADRVPVGPSNRFSGTSDRANDYVPEQLPDGRIVVTSDRDEFHSIKTCCSPPQEYTAILNPAIGHTIRVLASGLSNAGSAGVRIHLDAYTRDATIKEENTSTTYSGSWTTATSPNASMGRYKVATGTSGQFVDIAVPAGITSATLYLGRTRQSGVAQVLIDNIRITDGNFTLPGDAGGNKSGLDLYVPEMSTSNDLDLVIIDPTGSPQSNLTDNDLADEMLLIGDEVSWFCGLKPNNSECTYLQKSFTIEQLRLMSDSYNLLEPNFPNRCLYPQAFQALDQHMRSGGNGLRPYDSSYWSQVMFKMQMHWPPYDSELVVLPAPVGFCINNIAPSTPQNPLPADGAVLSSSPDSLKASPSTDPDLDVLTYDIYLAKSGEAMVLTERDSFAPKDSLPILQPATYDWQVVARDCRGGLKYGPKWSFRISAPCDCNYHLLGDMNNDGVPDVFDVIFLIDYVFSGGAAPPKDPLCPHINRSDVNCDGVPDVMDIIYLIDFIFSGGPAPCDPCLCSPYPLNCVLRK